MTLNELLTANPAAKIEYDAAIASAKIEGEKAMSATIEKVAPFLLSKDYPPSVAALAVKCLKGEESTTALTTVVATLDAVKEQQGIDTAAAATKKAGEATGEQHQQVDPLAVVSDEASLQAAVESAKGGN